MPIVVTYDLLPVRLRSSLAARNLTDRILLWELLMFEGGELPEEFRCARDVNEDEYRREFAHFLGQLILSQIGARVWLARKRVGTAELEVVITQVRFSVTVEPNIKEEIVV